MPPEILRAYQEKLNLQQLFSSRVIGDYKYTVLRRFLEEMIRLRGSTEVTLRPANTLVSVADLAALHQRYLPEEVISAVCASPDYGGKEETLPILAVAMESYWQAWWSSFVLQREPKDDVKIMSYVLGPRQLSWIAAQSARLVLSLTGNRYDFALQCIETAEQRSLGDFDEKAYSDLLLSTTRNEPVPARQERASRVALNAFFSTVYHSADKPSETIHGAISVLSSGRGVRDARVKVSNMIRGLITPTLITSASRTPR